MGKIKGYIEAFHIEGTGERKTQFDFVIHLELVNCLLEKRCPSAARLQIREVVIARTPKRGSVRSLHRFTKVCQAREPFFPSINSF